MAQLRSIHQIFRFIQIGGILTNIWPNYPNERKLIFILRKIDWSFNILNLIAVEISLMCAIYKYWDDVTTMMKTLAQFFAGLEMLLNLIIFKLKSTHIQSLLKELEDFFHTSNDNAGAILQKYIDRYFCFFVFVVICHCSAIIAFSCGPIFISTKFPLEVWYPFPIESPIVICILYITHISIIIKSGFNFIVNYMFAMFFMYSSARLEILCLKIRSAKNKWQINSCIKEHQEIIKFVNKTKYTVQYGLFKTNIMMASVIIFGVFPIIRKQPLWVSSQFIFMVICGYQRLYVTAWTADDLKENLLMILLRFKSKQVGMEVYNIPWVGNSKYNTKDIYFMIQRSQIPLEISIRGFLPTISLEYFTKYLVTMLSYFTTMRAIIGD